MLALVLGCYLLMVPVAPCDARVQAYETFARRLPPQHLAMVSNFYIRDGNHGRANYDRKTIGLPSQPGERVLYHEVGHIVAATLHLNDSYAQKFWKRGRPTGKTTEYGARSGPAEDLADCYSYIVIGKPIHCDAKRIDWLRKNAFHGTRFG